MAKITEIDTTEDVLAEQRRFVSHLLQRHAADINEWMPPGLLKRWPGHGIDRFVRNAPALSNIIANTTVVESGTSCRHQIEHLTLVRPKHMAELLADALSD